MFFKGVHCIIERCNLYCLRAADYPPIKLLQNCFIWQHVLPRSLLSNIRQPVKLAGKIVKGNIKDLLILMIQISQWEDIPKNFKTFKYWIKSIWSTLAQLPGLVLSLRVDFVLPLSQQQQEPSPEGSVLEVWNLTYKLLMVSV